MGAFIFGALVASLIIVALRGGRREPERIYIPVEPSYVHENRGGGWGWLGALPLLVILFVILQALGAP